MTNRKLEYYKHIARRARAKPKSWIYVGKWKWQGPKYAEQQRIKAVAKFGTEARVTKDGDVFYIYVWSTRDRVVKRIWRG